MHKGGAVMLIYQWISQSFLDPGVSQIQTGYIVVGLVAFCVLAAGVIAAVVLRAKKKQPKQRKTARIVSVAAAVVYVLCVVLFSLSNTGEFDSVLNPEVGFDRIYGTVAYENEKGRDVVYDRNGNAYTYRQYCKGFAYCDPAGNEYCLTTVSGPDGHQRMQCAATGQQYDIPDRMENADFYIDQDGYLYPTDRLPSTKTAFSPVGDYRVDQNGKKYFSWILVSWDRQGDLYYMDTPVNALPGVR